MMCVRNSVDSMSPYKVYEAKKKTFSTWDFWPKANQVCKGKLLRFTEVQMTPFLKNVQELTFFPLSTCKYLWHLKVM